MGLEIERKFLVDLNCWKPSGLRGRPLRQGYLARGGKCTVRVRTSDQNAWLTLKGPTIGISRSEYEYAIPLADGLELLKEFCLDSTVEKIRYDVVISGAHFEVDVFTGANAGLVVAEIELDDPEQTFPRPDWLGVEVSHDPRYRNAELARNPWSKWVAS
jgi:adenylate cyclase